MRPFPVFQPVLCSALLLVFACNLPSVFAKTVHYSRLGYYPKAQKLLVIQNVPAGQVVKVEIIDPSPTSGVAAWLKTQKVILQPLPTAHLPEQSDAWQGPRTESVVYDFSSLASSGKYLLKVDGSQEDAPLVLNEYLYWDLLKPLLRSLYLSRCGQEVVDTTGGFYHLPCHTQDGEPEGKQVTGGWHDEPGYVKRVTSTSLAVAHLAAMYQLSPTIFNALYLEYPSSEEWVGVVPDVLHEMQAGLNWLLSMQQANGLFYAAVGPKNQDAFSRPLSLQSIHDDTADHTERSFKEKAFKPDQDTAARTLLQDQAGNDTAMAVAALASASRSFKKKDLGYTVKCLLAAERGWDALNEKQPLPQAPEMRAYRLWAALELSLATQKPAYQQAVIALLQPDSPDNQVLPFIRPNHPLWLGIRDALLNDPSHKTLSPEVANALAGYAQKLAADAYQPLQKQQASRAFWSNSSPYTVSQLLDLFLTADALQHNPSYIQASCNILSAVFGLNPTSQVWVSGLGTASAASQTHQYSQAIDKTLPGLPIYLEQKSLQQAGSTEVSNQQALSMPAESAGLADALARLNQRLNTSTEK